MRILIQLVFFLFICSRLYAQNGRDTILLPLRILQGTPPIISQLATERVENITSFRHIPPGYKFWCIRQWTVVYLQELREQALTGKITTDRFEDYAKSVAMIDSPYKSVSSAILPGNKVAFFTGIDTTGKKIIIADANNNKDFNDDKIWTFDTSYFSRPFRSAGFLPTVNLDIQYFDRLTGAVTKIATPVMLNPFEYYNEDFESDPKERILDLVIECTRYRQTDLKLNGEKYTIYLCNNHNELPFTDRTNTNLLVETSAGKKKFYKLFDNLELGDSKYKIGGLKDEAELILIKIN
ncbi:hypothetical protein [Pseudobacter ginsenosidimutans]|uniref:Uncharacterized protein n=1 Tax=Pseudobacter ginsenosidimutans TaxID=661488 RepID=A0A4Q7MVS5_9BACT|nr:hypothetical protein [Pseudobacter ginsenosidimutans]QEC41107.1 hypothetical protein FSB84_05135 [Pseudobacter ginsenosidimutans]RZS72134.1 hypothetical protein EV199_4049 [Pseudobacter ginsenosidimutans]